MKACYLLPDTCYLLPPTEFWLLFLNFQFSFLYLCFVNEKIHTCNNYIFVPWGILGGSYGDTLLHG